jgi:hypothetical protein
MNPDEIIDEMKQRHAEWLEMCEDPAPLLAWVLAQKICYLEEHVQYLQNRLKHATKS